VLPQAFQCGIERAVETITQSAPRLLQADVILQQIRFGTAKQLNASTARCEAPFHILPSGGLGWIVPICCKALIEKAQMIFTHGKLTPIFTSEFDRKTAQQLFLLGHGKTFYSNLNLSQGTHSGR
jgi:hypothetical protein